MYQPTATGALFLLAVLRAVAQLPSPDPAPGLILRSASRAVQLEVSVDDPSRHPVHGLQKKDFVVTDDGRPRDLRIFAGEIDPNPAAPASPATAPAPGVYSNRLGLRDSRIVTAIVIDAVLRPYGLQDDAGSRGRTWPGGAALYSARFGARRAVSQMEPGQTMAIYAACPDLRVVQDYTNDPGRLLASLDAFACPRVPDGGKNQAREIEALIPPMLAALRGVAARMSGATGRKSVVWISQTYGAELNLSPIQAVTGSTVDAFNDANVTLYAVDTRVNTTCEPPSRADIEAGLGRRVVIPLTCIQPWDASDQWMQDLAAATGGRAFGGGQAFGYQERDPEGRMTTGRYGLNRDDAVSDAVLLAMEDSRNAYEMGFYVPDTELDGKVHMLSVTVAGKPKFALRYRSGYTASVNATAPSAQAQTASDLSRDTVAPVNANEVGIDARIDIPSKGPKELRVSFALDPATITSAADGVISIDETLTETDASGKQIAKVQETMQVPAPEGKPDMVRYTRSIRLANGALLLHITIRDQATNRVGSLAIPIGNQ
jgi:hypothetical protein